MEEENAVKCPCCNNKIYEVFFEDICRRWRCMTCNSIFSEPLWQMISKNEIVKAWQNLKKNITERF